MLSAKTTSSAPPRLRVSLIVAIIPAALLIAAFAAGPIAASDRARPETAGMIDPKTETAIGDALAWLASRQHEDGSFGSGDMRGNTAVTALCGMAFLAGGSTPNRGPYGEHVDRAVEYLLARTEQSGLIIDRRATSQGPMYGQGFATMFLAECYGMSRRPELREKLVRAVKLIVDSQNNEGGWRYWPDSTDADISVTICQIMALRAARNAGIHVPKQTVDRCVEYVKKCQNPDGGFTYMLGDRRESLFPRSAAGVVVLYSAGIYEGEEIAGGVEYLMQFLPKPGVNRQDAYYYYGQYYAVQAMWHVGGESWDQWYPAVRDELLARQHNDGSWPATSINREYATAMALIVLQVPNNYLPILQR